MDSRAQIYSITFTCLKSGEGGVFVAVYGAVRVLDLSCYNKRLFGPKAKPSQEPYEER